MHGDDQGRTARFVVVRMCVSACMCHLRLQLGVPLAAAVGEVSPFGCTTPPRVPRSPSVPIVGPGWDRDERGNALNWTLVSAGCYRGVPRCALADVGLLPC